MALALALGFADLTAGRGQLRCNLIVLDEVRLHCFCALFILELELGLLYCHLSKLLPSWQSACHVPWLYALTDTVTTASVVFEYQRAQAALVSLCVSLDLATAPQTCCFSLHCGYRHLQETATPEQQGSTQGRKGVQLHLMPWAQLYQWA